MLWITNTPLLLHCLEKYWGNPESAGISARFFFLFGLNPLEIPTNNMLVNFYLIIYSFSIAQLM
jgi:hypothetical protein